MVPGYLSRHAELDAAADAGKLRLVQAAHPEVRTLADATTRIARDRNEAGARDLVERWDTLNKGPIGEHRRHSFAGRLGRAVEPVLRPLGFDWKIGIGIVASFAAREVFVSTMSVVYNIGEIDAGDQAETSTLAEVMKSEKRADGSRCTRR